MPKHKIDKISHVMKMNLRSKENPKTREQYQRSCDKFTEFVQETYGRERIKPSLYPKAVQRYIDHLQELGKSPDTVHTYAVGVTQGLNLSYKDFEHENRTRPQKGREKAFETSGKLSDIGRAIGIRQKEYGKLKGEHLVEKDGHLFVVVTKGKGGKYQEQMILPQHENAVRELFKDKKPGEYIYTKDELKSFRHAHEHAARRELAREAYDYYKQLPRAEKDKLLEICHQRFLHKYDRKYPNAPEKSLARGERLWRQEMALIKRSPVRECRGTNKEALKSQGRETSFDREAVLLVSVLNLSHYREDVTVDNYLI